jgi:hypothetical protein
MLISWTSQLLLPRNLDCHHTMPTSALPDGVGSPHIHNEAP